MSNINLTDSIDLNFYSEGMVVSEKFLIEHHLKFTYQRQLISNLEFKHKEWSKYFRNKSI